MSSFFPSMTHFWKWDRFFQVLPPISKYDPLSQVWHCCFFFSGRTSSRMRWKCSSWSTMIQFTSSLRSWILWFDWQISRTLHKYWQNWKSKKWLFVQFKIGGGYQPSMRSRCKLVYISMGWWVYKYEISCNLMRTKERIKKAYKSNSTFAREK